MTKIVSLLAVALMLMHIIRPIGLPGLKRRRDFWKIAIVMIAAIIFTALMRETNQ